MQEGLVSCILILCLVSPCLCLKWSNFGVETEESTYNVLDYGTNGNGESDDSNAFLSAWNDTCRSQGIANLVIPKGKVFMLKNLELKGPCKANSIHIQLFGNIVAPTKDEWVDDKKDLIIISNVNSLTIDGGGYIEGNGNTWWERCKDCTRPGVLRFSSCNDLSVSSLNLVNSPRFHIAINNCKNARFFNMNINAPGNSPNTDAYDISNSKNVVFQDSTIAVGDDCIAINGGCSYINATGITCGPGHGISIGSLGKNKDYETVEEVHVKNCTFKGTTNGARIKTWEGGSGYVRNIIFEDIILIEAKNPIIIDQHYGSKNANIEVVSMPISDVTFRGFEGTCAKEKAINLNCSSNGCFNIILDQINIVASNPKKKAQAFVTNVHGIVQNVIPKVYGMLE
ncbi:PREDICTED: probable polygalacturonase At3g15720 [Lupinus angustifolius]|uniref:probable polygalacturonase At3g15720 n=1 Tax=Lupinus angustifolius TaxID=3871 RepID=UPI00092E5B64|nr:PREDICTED: probable polygalacturonase At3g15720 [Lupinus angustifolius]